MNRVSIVVHSTMWLAVLFTAEVINAAILIKKFAEIFAGLIVIKTVLYTVVTIMNFQNLE